MYYFCVPNFFLSVVHVFADTLMFLLISIIYWQFSIEIQFSKAKKVVQDHIRASKDINTIPVYKKRNKQTATEQSIKFLYILYAPSEPAKWPLLQTPFHTLYRHEAFHQCVQTRASTGG